MAYYRSSHSGMRGRSCIAGQKYMRLTDQPAQPHSPKPSMSTDIQCSRIEVNVLGGLSALLNMIIRSTLCSRHTPPVEVQAY